MLRLEWRGSAEPVFLNVYGAQELIPRNEFRSLYVARAGIFKQSRGARNRVGIGLSHRPTRLHRLAKLIPWNRFLGSINVEKYGLWRSGTITLFLLGS
jgi:hypothetical protein